MKNRSPQVRKARARAKARRLARAYHAGRMPYQKVATARSLWLRWKYGLGPLVLYTTFRTDPNDMPF